jgi:oxygen-independent coproporphyrinogen-3 oxidase
MAGIYIHIPFCKTKCHYCDFYKTTDFGAKTDFLSALKQEIVWRKDELQQEKIASIYFGGGTPSVLKISEINEILGLIEKSFSLEDDVEITMEANPDDLTEVFVQGLKTTVINRLSIGTQSFHDGDLKSMNRRHNSAQALKSIQLANEAGIENISIDLIYGLPNQTLEAWKQNVEKAVSLNVRHISAYHLTYHEGTVFYEYLKKGKIKELPDELSFQQFKLLLQLLKEAGFEQYEISNFARNGCYSRHNKAYWERKKYLGFGPSAHSFDEKTRRWNVSGLGKYIHAIETKSVFWESEILSSQDQYNDYMITSLRTKWGISAAYLRRNFPEKFHLHFQNEAMKFISTKHLMFEQGVYKLSDEGLFISDKIMEELLFIVN